MIKAALILEGGAMRGVYTSGVLDALMENNIELEGVYGISAGSKNGQYYITKQKGEAIKVDLFCAGNKKAVSIRNLFFKGGVINRFYYKDYILKTYAPLDMEKFKESKQRFFIGATDCISGEIKFFEANEDNIADAICASCSIPLIQSMIYIDNIPYLDGGVADSIPFQRAYDDGYSKQIIVLTRPKGYRASPLNKEMIRMIKKLYRRYPNLLNKIMSNTERYNKMLDEIDKLEEENKVVVIRPSKFIPISRLEKNTDKLEDLYQLGIDDLKNNLDKINDYLKY